MGGNTTTQIYFILGSPQTTLEKRMSESSLGILEKLLCSLTLPVVSLVSYNCTVLFLDKCIGYQGRIQDSHQGYEPSGGSGIQFNYIFPKTV